MRIRGERECQDCGARWAYYDSGTLACPECGSIHSVGVDERTQHTDAAVDLDLDPVRQAVDEQPLHRIADLAKDACRPYVNRRGFISRGELRPLDDTYLIAAELTHVADHLGRRMDPTDAERLYFLELLANADQGDRPPASEVPDRLAPARGLAVAEAVRTYKRELKTWEDGHLDDQLSVLERLEAHLRRIRNLQGDVDPEEAEKLVDVIRALHEGMTGDDRDTAFARAEGTLDELSESV